MKLSNLLVLLGLVAIGAAVAYEVARPRPVTAPPVESRGPQLADETARMEGGLRWSHTKGSTELFDLFAASLVGIEGGAHFLEDVSKVRVYLADGRAVTLTGERGTLRELVEGRQGEVEVVLAGDVVVEDPDGMRLTTEELRYDAGRQIIVSPGPTRIRGRGLSARLSQAEYRLEPRVVESRGPLVAELGPGVPWRIDADRAVYRISTGELVIPENFRARQPDKTLIAGAGEIRAGGEGETTHFTGEGPVLLTGPAMGNDVQIVASGIEVFEPPDGGALGRRIDLGDPVSAALRVPPGEPRAGDGALRATHWTIVEDADGGWTATGGPGFDARWRTDATGETWRGFGETLVIERAADGRWSSMRGDGDVRLLGSDGQTVEGTAFEWLAERPQEVAVLGPRARALRDGDVIEAPRLVLLRDRNRIVGEDDPITEIRSIVGRGDALFASREPLRVRSARVSAGLDEGEIVFDGPVRAWQLDTTLDAQAMRFDRRSELLNARGDVVGRFVVGSQDSPRVVRVRSRELDYHAGTRRAVLTGEAAFTDVPTEVLADRIEVTLAEEGGVAELVAVGDVQLEHGPDHGSCDRLVWTGGDDPNVVLIGESSLARLFPERHGKEVISPWIRYHPSTGAFETRAGGGRTVIAGPNESEPAPSEDEQ